MFSIKLLAQFIIFLKKYLSCYSIKIADITLGDLYLSKEESKDTIELLTKREILKTIN